MHRVASLITFLPHHVAVLSVAGTRFIDISTIWGPYETLQVMEDIFHRTLILWHGHIIC